MYRPVSDAAWEHGLDPRTEVFHISAYGVEVMVPLESGRAFELTGLGWMEVVIGKDRFYVNLSAAGARAQTETDLPKGFGGRRWVPASAREEELQWFLRAFEEAKSLAGFDAQDLTNHMLAAMEDFRYRGVTAAHATTKVFPPSLSSPAQGHVERDLSARFGRICDLGR